MQRQEFVCTCGQSFDSFSDMEEHYRELHSAKRYRAPNFEHWDEYVRSNSHKSKNQRTPDPFEYLLSSG